MPPAAVSAPQPEAVETGAQVLMRGGNAVDAAIATALVQGVVDPYMCGIAGFGTMQIYLPERSVHTCVDFHAKAPAAATADMWEHLLVGEARDGFGFELKGRVNDVGYQSIAVPGSLRAYHEAQTRFGRLDWPDVVAPAIDHAENGWVVRPAVAGFWSEPEELGRSDTLTRLAHSATGRAIYLDSGGRPRRVGDRIRNPDLAQTLSVIARDGAEAFYSGVIAERIAEDMATNGALLTLDDLRAYRTTWTDPLWGSYRDHRIATSRPPAGGVVLLEMLHTLEHFDLAALPHNGADYLAIVAEAMKWATLDKDRYVGDPAFVDVPVERLISPEHTGEIAEKIRRGDRARVPRVTSKESVNTTQVSVLDRDGNAVTMTHSLGMPSGVITDGLGFTYNGCMAVFDPRPGRAHSIAPGKSRFTAMCPSIVYAGDRPRLVVGAPGGAHIAVAVLQVMLNVVDFDMTLLEAVSAPRIAATSDAIDVSNRIPRYVTDALEAKGQEIVRSPLSYAFASVHGVGVRDDGTVEGAADPGRDGMALIV